MIVLPPPRLRKVSTPTAARANPLGFTALQLSTDRDPGAIHGEPLRPGMLTTKVLVEEGQALPDPEVYEALGQADALVGELLEAHVGRLDDVRLDLVLAADEERQLDAVALGHEGEAMLAVAIGHRLGVAGARVGERRSSRTGVELLDVSTGIDYAGLPERERVEAAGLVVARVMSDAR